MKICNTCSSQVDDNARFCYKCGTSLAQNLPSNRAPHQPVYQQPTYQQPVYQQQPAYQPSAGEQFTSQTQSQTGIPIYDALGSSQPSSVAPKNNGKILPGLLGAVLFSLAGVLLYCILYQAGVIAGIAGIFIYLLAYKGYGILSGAKNSFSPVGIAASVITMIVMIFVSEYISLGVAIFIAFEDAGCTLAEAFEQIPEFLEDGEVSEAVTGDLMYAYIFGIISVIGNIISIRKERKKAK